MTISLTLTVLMFLALLSFTLAAFNVVLTPRVNLGWLGAAILTLVFLLMQGLIG